MFTAKDVAEYYNTTQNHYERWWGLKKNLSFHYGIWDAHTKNFQEASHNTNKKMLEFSGINKDDHVLDAGCGVGGSSFFMHGLTGCRVTGITLSNKQLKTAEKLLPDMKMDANKVGFQIMDFTNTSFPAESFDVVWACESVCQAESKEDFIKESYRLLKKGGRLVLCDFFSTGKLVVGNKNWLKAWEKSWAVPAFAELNIFLGQLNQQGYKVTTRDYTAQINKSAKRLYYASLLGAIPSEVYNLFHPQVSRFARHHYKCGYFQYKALKKKQWEYHMLLAVK